MENLKLLITELINFLNKNDINYFSNRWSLWQDLSKVYTFKIKKDYMILPATPRNIEIVKNLQELFPSIEVYDKNKDGIDKKSKSVELFYYLTHLSSYPDNREKYDPEEVFQRISDKAIIIKRDEAINNYLESAKIANMLSGQKKYVVKEINYFSGYGMYLSNYRGGLSCELSKYFALSKDKFKIQNLHMNNNYTFDITIRAKKELKNFITQNDIKTLKTTKEYIKKIRLEAEEHAEDVFVFKDKKKDVRKFQVYLHSSELKELKINSTSERYLDISNTYHRKRSPELHYNVTFKEVEFDVIFDMIDKTLFKNKASKKLLVK